MTARKPKVRVVAIHDSVSAVNIGRSYAGFIEPGGINGWSAFPASGATPTEHPTRAAAVRVVVAAWRAKEKP